MHQSHDAARTFTRRLLLGCLALTVVLLLLTLGAWLKSFTLPQTPPRPPDPVAAPPPATVTVTVTPSGASNETPARRDRSRRASAAASLPAGTDGAAQAACGARAQAAALREAGRRAEAAVQAKAAEEAALASTVPALRDLKKLRTKEIVSRLDAWCSSHFTDLKPRPLPSSPRPTTSGPRGTHTVTPVCRTPNPYDRGLGPGLDDHNPDDPRCARH
ncbi:hypothetical protein [Actinocorallia populi]|uniref:hypothetical protein n=1 Tax=Actinocorallia populi TaxID=2079200 RepID=UPI000D095B13|nr:hypothetical protein [Actinocorallia populi]